jgi:uncharacterized protein (DUF697 family)
MSFNKDEKAHGIIHTASVAAAGVGAGLAQIPGSDCAVIVPIQVSMIIAIALVHDRKVTEATATSLLGTFTATMVGRTISQWLVGWMPGIGNLINASTAAGLTEAVGWSANAFFEELGR